MKKSEYPNSKYETNKNFQISNAQNILDFVFRSFKFVSNLVLRISDFKLQAGQSLVEIVLVIGLSAIILPALLTGLISSRQGKAQQVQRTQAVYLLNETVDAVRSVREKGWTSFATNGIFHPSILGTSWSLATGSAVIDGFTQEVIIGGVNRDSSGTIASMGGTLDPSSKKVDIVISWDQPYLSTVSASLYMTRYLGNNSFTQTSVADFEVGTKSGTIITNTSGGEVTLSAGGHGEWCDPNLSIAALDLPKNGVANALTAIEGRVFAGTGENASGVSFANVNITTTYPPVASIQGTFNGYKTNGVFGEANYAYLATDNHTKEIEIINIVSTPYTEAGYFNAPGNGNGDSIFISGNIGYMTDGSNLYSFNLSSKNGSRPQLGSVSLAGEGRKVFVVGTYAYVAIESSGTQMQIINIANPSSMSVVGQASVNGLEAKDVFINSTGTRAYIVTETSSDKREFFIIDISTKTGNRPTLGSYEAQGMSPKGVTVVTNNKAILVGTGGEEYQVINIATESSPIRCGGLNMDTGVNGVSSVIQSNGDVYSYIITGDSSGELKIIEGGPGGQYSSSGTFISGPFDAGYSTAFNRFDISVNRPSTSDIAFQVAAAPAVGGSCTGAIFNFVGPGASLSAFFTTSITSGVQSFSYSIPPIINPGRCFKYKAFLSTIDSLSTPIFYDMTGNFSP